MNISDQVKARFVKDQNLPIPVMKEPYFTYFTAIYDRLFNISSKWQMLQEILKENSEEEFFSMVHKVRDQMIEYIKGTGTYNEFISCDMQELLNIKKDALPNKKIYIPENVGQEMISIDLVSANFSCLHYFDQELCESHDLFPDVYTYEGFCGKYTKYDYFKQCKQIRQVVFGNVNPKRQQTLQKRMIAGLIDIILEECTDISIETASSDEIIVKSTGGDLNETLQKINSAIGGDNNRIKCEIFTLHQIGNKPYYVKESGINTIQTGNMSNYSFKCVPTHHFAQCFKEFFKSSIHEYDMYFTHEKKVATYVERLFENGCK